VPTYTYKCQQCGIQFESFQSMMDPPLQTCPSCHGELQRVITGGSGLIFRGSGFYITDYSKKRSNGNKSEKKSETKTKESKAD
jgi:putative FmdB family regulatory protein